MKDLKNNLMSKELINCVKQEIKNEIIRNVLKINKKSKNNDLKNKIHYVVSYSNNKILVDITKNDVFSYLDSEKELIKKMKMYIKTEQYEKAEILKNYFNTIELDYE